MKMSKRAHEALLKSIEHHKRLLACKTVGDVKTEGFGPDECALCQLYFDDFCQECPVAIRVGETRCIGTPFDREAKELRNFVGFMRETVPTKHIRREIDFLESLLPERMGNDMPGTGGDMGSADLKLSPACRIIRERFAKNAEEFDGMLVDVLSENDRLRIQVGAMSKALESGRNYLMCVDADDINVSAALESFGFGKLGLFDPVEQFGGESD